MSRQEYTIGGITLSSGKGRASKREQNTYLVFQHSHSAEVVTSVSKFPASAP